MKHTVNIGGLYRCCLASLDAHADEAAAKEAAVLHCAHCGEAVRLTRGVWRWAPDVPIQKRPEPAPPGE